MNPAPQPVHPAQLAARPNRRVQMGRVAIGAVAVATLIAGCGSDSSDDAPSTTNPGSMPIDTASGSGDGGGVPLEPGSNLPPDDAPGAPSSDTPNIGEPAIDNQGDLPDDTVAPE